MWEHVWRVLQARRHGENPRITYKQIHGSWEHKQGEGLPQLYWTYMQTITHHILDFGLGWRSKPSHIQRRCWKEQKIAWLKNGRR